MNLRFTARAALCALVFATSASAGEQMLATYPKTVHTRIGNDLIINGQYYRMAYFTTSDSLDAVATYFIKTWNAEGFPTTYDGDMKEEAVVSSFYTREGLQRSVVLRKHQGKTVGFTTLIDLWVTPPNKNPPAIVQLEGTLTTAKVASRDTLGAAMSSTSIVEAPLANARQDAIDKYTARGFELKREVGSVADGKQQYVLDFADGPQDVMVHLGAVDAELTAVSITANVSTAKDNAPNPTAKDAMRAPSEKATKNRKERK